MNEKEQRERLLPEMQEHPEKYTDEEIELLLADEEAREDLRALSLLKRALVRADHPENEVDAEKEWERFAQSHPAKQPKTKHLRWIRSVAAVFIGVVATGLVYAAAVHFHLVRNVFAPSAQSTEPSMPAETTGRAIVSLADSLQTPADTIAAPVVYDNETLEKILTDFAACYNVKVEYADNALKGLRLFFTWDKSAGVERSVAVLNTFHRIHVTLSNGVLRVESGSESERDKEGGRK